MISIRSKYSLISAIFFYCLFYSFNSNGQIEKIDLDKAFLSRGSINLSEIADSVEYIKLETDSIHYCGPQTRVYANKKYIITISMNNMFVFERQTGKFLWEIGTKGNTDNDYLLTNYILPFDENRSIVTAKSSNNSIFEYSIEGKLLRKISTPSSYGNTIYWKNGKYVQYVSNLSGLEKRRIIIFNSDNKIAKTFLNKQQFIKEKKETFFSNKEGGFYKFKNNLYFKETFNDTVYLITNNSLVPRYSFESEDKKLVYDLKGKIDLQTKRLYYFISNLFETSNFLFFEVAYDNRFFSAVYLKKQKTCKVSDCGMSNRNGFINNIDGYLPMYFSSVNASNEIIGHCLPFEVNQWLKNSANSQSNKIFKDIAKIKNNENPVVVIAKLKDY